MQNERRVNVETAEVSVRAATYFDLGACCFGSIDVTKNFRKLFFVNLWANIGPLHTRIALHDLGNALLESHYEIFTNLFVHQKASARQADLASVVVLLGSERDS
ncbi:unannotated protein [freshwater metagenome]|uniref:Unannotated protein n=1 Tax=freshwater metagenome TaxID=449393 RepID=A0A6J7TF99_9ZZZZ